MRDLNYANKASDGEKLKRDFDKIAEIIAKEDFDIVGLQELNSESALKHLNMILNRNYKNRTHNYECVFGDGMPTHSSDPERYGFIWNAEKFRLLHVKRGTNPGYYTNAGGLDVIRPPYYGRFTARGMLGGSNFELRLINIHIRDANKKNDRIKEFDILVKQVLPRICDHQDITEDGEIMPSYTFLLGDYNLCLNQGAVWKIEPITMTSYTGRQRRFETVQKEKTSLRQVGDQKCIEDCYSQDYDHFTYEDELLLKLKLKSERVEALSEYFAVEKDASQKLKSYREKVSDHVPIKLTIDLK
jgi:endonuclease/exonuclease/phosphatase family metal-dependent hydrolase